jgi:hypothetical protein
VEGICAAVDTSCSAERKTEWRSSLLVMKSAVLRVRKNRALAGAPSGQMIARHARRVYSLRAKTSP